MQHSDIFIQGTVRNPEGRVLGLNVQVEIHREDGSLIDRTITSSDGTYYFKGLPGGAYQLIFTAPGFERHEEAIPSSIGIRIVICNVTLHPLSKKNEDPDALKPRTSSQVPKDAKKEYDKATKELDARQLKKAAEHLKKAIEIYPCYAEAQAHIAVLFEGQNDDKGAEAALRKAIECDPDYVSPYTLLGQLLNTQKRFAESVPVLEEGVRRAPSSWPLPYELGVAYFGLGDYTKSEGQFQRVSELSTKPPADLPLRLADVHIKLKAYDKAYAEMKQYLQAQPNGFYAARVRDTMQQVSAMSHP